MTANATQRRMTMKIAETLLFLTAIAAAQTPKPAPAKTEPCVVLDPEDNGPPKLKRGKPTEPRAKRDCDTRAEPIGRTEPAGEVVHVDRDGAVEDAREGAGAPVVDEASLP